jgi:hypothetical protein
VAFIHFAVWPFGDPESLDFSVAPFAFVYLPVRKIVSALSTAFTLLEHAFILVAIGVDLNARTVHHIILPVTFVFGLGSGMEVDAVSIGFVIFPFTVVSVVIGMSELTFATCFVFLPLSFVFGAVGPELDAVSVAI